MKYLENISVGKNPVVRNASDEAVEKWQLKT
jgi:head-tail adaptor